MIHYRNAPAVIYVHPKTPMLFRCIIPVSVPAIIDRISYPVTGYYPDELQSIDLNKVKIVIMDIHWYLSLNGALELAQYIKEKNSQIIIIAGGLTASLFAGILVKQTPIDYIVRGDGEVPTAQLVDALMNNKSIDTVPNLVGKHEFITPWSFALSQEEMNLNNYYDIDFFPSFKLDTYKIHRYNSGWPVSIFPYLMSFRGCPVDCQNCLGGLSEQQTQFKRGPVFRTAENVKKDLQFLSNNENITFANSHIDYITFYEDKDVLSLFSKRYKLKIQHDFMKVPPRSVLELFLNSFSGGTICFSMDKYHATSEIIEDPEKLIEAINFVKSKKEYHLLLYYVKRYLKTNKEYRAALKYIVKKTNCCLYSADFFWGDAPPNQNGDGDTLEYKRCMAISQGKENKFRVSNILARGGLLIDRFVPYMSVPMRQLIYRCQNNLSLYL